jgi:uncharacterized protein (DUF983 family)
MALPPAVLLRRAVLRRCPVCGSGRLFRHWFSMAPACPGCGFVFRRTPGHWLGSWFLSVMLVQTVLVVTITVVVAITWPERPSMAVFVLLAGLSVAVPALFFPFSRTLWTAMDLIMRPLDFDDGVAPGVELEQTERHASGPPDQRRPPPSS